MRAENANQEQITYWNEQAGPKWVELQDLLDSQIGMLGEQMLDAADPAAGERVLDVGCGCGASTLSIARRVGPTGSVLGVDISAPMLERARARAAEAGHANVSFLQADAQTHRFEGGAADLVTSRFGVMFFDEPVAAFANLASALRSGGRLAFVCWQPLAANPWMQVPLMAAVPHLPSPLSPPPPDAPGPFALGDAERVRKILSEAGFEDVTIDPLAGELGIGGDTTLDKSVDFILRMGPTARVLADVDDAVRAKVRAAVQESLRPYESATGVRMSYGCWLAAARKP